jgi:beta-galactosidase/beta-glucuronidase
MMIRLDLILAVLVFAGLTIFSAKGISGMPRAEHPRPDLFREAWQGLNGEWYFQEDSGDVGVSDEWFSRESLSEKIIVPFEVESRLSGLGRENPSNVLWYVREFEVDDALKGKRVILHFGAVDYHAKVWLNGAYLGDHKGGYTPFWFDVTDSLKEGNNRVAVRVFDSKSTLQVRGKQTFKDAGFMIHYTATSGIWQSVWLEAVGPIYIIRYQILFDRHKGEARIRVFTDRASPGHFLSVEIKDPGGMAVIGPERVEIQSDVTELCWKVDDARLWSPAEPNLYDLRFQVSDENGDVVDEVSGYAGLRTIEVTDGEVLLNGEPVYQKLLLVQGYFTPEAVYSPESDDAFRRDVEAAKGMGFNGARVHQKIEDPRYYYWCDKLGFLIWEEMPSMVFWKILRNPDRKARDQFQVEMREMIERDFNHPSVIVWTLFNESWGLHDAMWSRRARRWWMECVDMAHELDPTRLVVDNSGWLHRKTDILDVHHYLQTAQKSVALYEKLKQPWGTRFALGHTIMNAARGMAVVSPLFWGTRYKGQPIIISEYGGFGFYKTQEKSLLDNYREYTEAIGRYDYIKGYCYTQQYDIEQEQNGLQRQDRSFKVPPEDIKKINDSMGK